MTNTVSMVHKSSSVEEGSAILEPFSSDLRGSTAPNFVNFLVIKACKNHFSVLKGNFRFEKLLRNCCFTRYRQGWRQGKAIAPVGAC